MLDPVLVTWGLRRRRGRSPRSILALGGLGLGLIGLTPFGRPAPLIVYNATASAPIGLYRVLRDRPIARGDLVFAWAPADARRLAAMRGYVPESVPLVKRVAALAGDRVCVQGLRVFINGHASAVQRAADGLGRPLPLWRGCRPLGAQELFLLMPSVPASFDGRYFGPVDRSAVLGRLEPLWLR